jgi:hypothetical protein
MPRFAPVTTATVSPVHHAAALLHACRAAQQIRNELELIEGRS